MFVIKFMGGLGNQLFQYGLLLYLQERFPNTDIRIDLSYFDNYPGHNGFELDTIVKNKHFSRFIKREFCHVTESDFNNADFSKDLYFDGYWQDEKYLPRSNSIFSNLYKEFRCEGRDAEVFSMITSTNSVSIHVRRGDYLEHPVHGNIANETYFINSINYIRKNVEHPIFFVFSDDIYWSKKHLNLEENEVCFIDWNTGPHARNDLFLMSKCRNNIISNSSFSWWAQYFNHAQDKIIIAPEYWFNQKMDFNSIDINPEPIRIPNVPLNTKKSAKPFFSVIIPVFNSAYTLRRCLSSVLNQANVDFEVICVNDCSNDDSYDILKTYAKRDPRITVLNHEVNRGLLAARYSGIDKATGRYIIFLDSDDWFTSDAFELLTKSLIASPVDVLEFAYIHQPSKHIVLPKKGYEQNRVSAIMRVHDPYPKTVWNKVYRSEMVKHAVSDIEPFYAIMAEDAFYSVVFAYYAKTYGYLDSVIHNYSVGSGVSTTTGSSIENNIKALESIRTVLAKITEFFEVHDRSRISDCKGLEAQLLRDALYGQILGRTKPEDIDASLLLLPAYFNHELLVPYIATLRLKVNKANSFASHSLKSILKMYVREQYPVLFRFMRLMKNKALRILYWVN